MEGICYWIDRGASLFCRHYASDSSSVIDFQSVQVGKQHTAKMLPPEQPPSSNIHLKKDGKAREIKSGKKVKVFSPQKQGYVYRLPV